MLDSGPLITNFRIEFGLAGNCQEFLTDGWSSPETAHRWSIGRSSALRFPAFDIVGDAILTMTVQPFLHHGEMSTQKLSIHLNGAIVDEFTLAEGWHHYSMVLPWDSLSKFRDNTIEMRHPYAARPSDYGGDDTRELAICFRSIAIEAHPLRLYSKPQPLPRSPGKLSSGAQLRLLASQFQSLGQNSEFAQLQSACGVESSLMTTIQSIPLPQLISGLESRFAQIGDADSLEFLEHGDSNGQISVRHRHYGLETRRFNPGDDLASIRISLAAQFSDLARRLVACANGAETIFVVQRDVLPLTMRELLPLFRVLRSYNPGNSLLCIAQVGPSERDLLGRAELLAPHFYRGYVDRLELAEGGEAKAEAWIDVCRSVSETVWISKLGKHAT